MATSLTDGMSVSVEVLEPLPQASAPADLALRDLGPISPRPSRRVRPRWWFELGFVVVLDLLYEMIRNEAPDQVAEAVGNSRSVLHVEHLVGLDIESGINALFASHAWLAIPANYCYSTLHTVVAVAVLVWLYVARPTRYRRARSVLLAMTLIALVGYWLFPLAPPRLTTGAGFVDTVRAFSTWGVSPATPVVSASNPYAAMPSMHVGWALWSGTMLARFAHRPWLRVLGVCYPLATFLVVVATANHFVLDGLVAAVVFVGSLAVVHLVGRAATRTRRWVRPGVLLSGRPRAGGLAPVTKPAS